MKRRWALRFVLFVVAAVAAVVLVLRTPWAGEELCSTARMLLPRLLGQPVELGACEVDPLTARVRVHDVSLGDGRTMPKVRASSVALRLSPIALGRALSIEELDVDSPRVEWTIPEGEGAEEEKASPTGRCLAVLERVHLGKLRIRDASAALRLPTGETIEATGFELRAFGDRRSIRAKVALSSARFTSGESSVPLDRFEATFALDPSAETLAVDALSLQGAGVRLDAQGAIRTLCVPSFDLSGELHAELSKTAALLAPDLDDAAGRLRATFEVKGAADAPEATLQASLEEIAFSDFELGAIELKASATKEKAVLSELIWKVHEGRAIVAGEVEFAEGLPATAEVRTERLEFHRLMAALPVKNTPVMMSIDSVHRLQGKLDGLRLQGRSDLQIRSFAVRNEPWHAPGGIDIVEIPGVATMSSQVTITDRAVVMENARAAYGAGTSLQFFARLAFSEAEGLDIRARSSHFDLAHIAGHVAGIPLGGVAELEAAIVGPYPDPLIEGSVTLQDGRLYAAKLGTLRSSVRSRPAEGTLDFPDATGEKGVSLYDARVFLVLGGDPKLEGELAMRSGSRLRDLFDAVGGFVYPLEWMRENLDGRVESVWASFSGKLPQLRATGRIEARDATLLERPFDRLSADLELPDLSELRIDSLRLERGEGAATATASIGFPEEGASIEADIEADALPLRELLGSFGEFADLRGEVGARARLFGEVESLGLAGELYAEQVSAHGVELQPTRLNMESRGGQVVIRGPVAGAGTLSGVLRLRDDLPYEAQLQLEIGELARFLPKELELSGVARGVAEARGGLSNLIESSGKVRLDELVLAHRGTRVRAVAPLRLGFDGSTFAIEPLRLQGEGTEIFLAGGRELSGRLDMQVQGRFDAGIFDSLVPQIEHASGDVEIRAAVTGTMDLPLVVGSAEVRDGAFRVRPLPIQVQRLRGKLAFSQNQLVVEEATLQVNGGPSRLRGSVSLRDFSPTTFDLALDGERIPWRMPADWPAVVSGDLHLGGSWPTSLRLTGELDVERLRYARDLDLERMVLDFRQRVTQVPAAQAEEFIHLDVALVGGSDMRVDNNLVRARLAFVAPPGMPRGRLRLVGSNTRFGLLGSVEILDGVAFFRGNEYRITHGVVAFEDRSRIDPTFDFTAETAVREYQVMVHGIGRLADGGEGEGFSLELASDPMLAQADIITLLTFGLTSKDLDRSGSALTGAGVAAEALLTVSGLDQHVKRWLPESEVLQEPEFSLTSQYSEITGQVEPMATFEARLITDKLRLKAAAPFSSAKGTRVSAEYRFGDRLSSQIIWEDEETGYSAGDLGADLKLRWEWD